MATQWRTWLKDWRRTKVWCAIWILSPALSSAAGAPEAAASAPASSQIATATAGRPTPANAVTADAATSASCGTAPPPVSICKVGDSSIGLCADAPLLLVAPDGSASGTARICNSTGAPVAVDATASAFTGGPCQDTPVPGSSVNLVKPAGLPNIPVPAQTCVAVALSASKAGQAGLLFADVFDGGKPIGRIRALRQDVPFAVKFDGPTPEKISIAFTKGQESKLRLKNDDSLSYPFHWSLDLGDCHREGHAWIAPRGEVALPIELDACPGDAAPIGFLESGFMRSGSIAGRLLLEYRPDPALTHLDLKKQRYPVEATLNFWSKNGQRFVTLGTVFFVLFLGILASLCVNYALPMQRKRIATKQRLADQEGRMIGLSTVIDSRTLSLLRSEKRRLRAELQSLSPFVPATEDALQKLDVKIDLLGRRIDLTVKAGNLKRATSLNASFADIEVTAVVDVCDAVLDVVKKPEIDAVDLKAAETQLLVGAKLLADARQAPNADMVTAVQARFAALPNALRYDRADAIRAACWKRFEDLVTVIRAAAPVGANLSREEYVRACAGCARAEHVFKYNDLVDRAGNQNVYDRRFACADGLLNALLPGDEESVTRARDILQQVEEGVSATNLTAHLDAARTEPFITADPPVPLPRQLVTFRVQLSKPGQNTASARREIPCEWTVDGNPQPEASGWAWTTFFEERSIPFEASSAHIKQRVRQFLRWMLRRPPMVADTYSVKASIRLPGKPPLEVGPLTIRLDSPKAYGESKTTYAVVTLLITVVAVGFGLLAAAQEKLQTLDWATGLGAVLVLGFSADALKRVLTRT